MYFSDVFRLKREDEYLIFSFRVTEKKVEEHRLLINTVGSAFQNLSDQWQGSSVLQIKKKGGDMVFIKFHTSDQRSDIYCLSASEYRLLHSMYLSISEVS